jgi:predicted porin
LGFLYSKEEVMSVKKNTLIAVAVAAAFSSPLVVQAQTNVTVYGKLYPHVASIRTSGATPVGTANMSSLSSAPTGARSSKQTVMQSSNSRIGFRGTEDLGGGLKAIFQLESSFSVDSGTLNANNVLWGQDTFVGLAGGFGTVKLGKMDTPYKNLGDPISFFGTVSGNFTASSAVLANQNWGVGNAHRFHERKNNAISYESPRFAGFQVLAQYALGEQAGNTSGGSTTTAGVKYEAGPIYVALAHEHHEDQFGGSLNMPTAGLRTTAGKESDDDATRLTVAYRLAPQTRIAALVSSVRLKEEGPGTLTAGSFREYRHNTWNVSGEHGIGPVTLFASYGQAGAGKCTLTAVACTTAGLDSKQLSLGSFYSLSKRTQLFLTASQFKNGHSANFSNAVGRVNPGEDTKVVALGIHHTF